MVPFGGHVRARGTDRIGVNEGFVLPLGALPTGGPGADLGAGFAVNGRAGLVVEDLATEASVVERFRIYRGKNIVLLIPSPHRLQ